MKRNFKSIAGVTLLEIMLVLAIAAMIVVMSIKYYQTATTQEQVNTIMDEIQAIAVAADSMESGTGSYSGVGTGSGFTSLLPVKNLITPWGGSFTITGAGATYTMSLGNTPHGTCASINTRISTNNHYTASCASGVGTMNITYNAAT